MPRRIEDYYDASLSVRCMLDMCRRIRKRLEGFPERLRLLRATCFGPWVDLEYDERDPILVHCMLLSQHFPEGFTDYLEFHVGDREMLFTREDFCLITGFRFGLQRVFCKKVDDTFRVRHFPNWAGKIVVSDIIKLFLNDTRFQQMSNSDSVRLCLLIIFHSVFMAREGKLSVLDNFFNLVDDFDAWNDYPWGSHFWDVTSKQIRHTMGPKEVEHRNRLAAGALPSYSLTGFIFAFKIWIYEVFPYTTKCNYATYTSKIPRALGWHRIVNTPKWKDVLAFILTADREGLAPRERLVPTVEERATPWFKDSWSYFGHRVGEVVQPTGSSSSYRVIEPLLHQFSKTSPPHRPPVASRPSPRVVAPLRPALTPGFPSFGAAPSQPTAVGPLSPPSYLSGRVEDVHVVVEELLSRRRGVGEPEPDTDNVTATRTGTKPEMDREHVAATWTEAEMDTDVPPMRVKRQMDPVHNTMANKVAKLDVPNLGAEDKQIETIPRDKIMLEAKIKMQDEVIAKQKAMFVAKIQIQDEVIAKQKAMFLAKIQMQDEVIAEQKAKVQMQDVVLAEQNAKVQVQDAVIAKQMAKVRIQDEVIAKQKAMFEAKIKMQDKVIAEAKTQMLETEKLQHEKLMSRIIKCKIAELQVQVESGNPDYEVIRSMGCDIKLAMEFIPESLRVVMEAQFSFQYVELKSLLFSHINASQWEKIESELLKIRDS